MCFWSCAKYTFVNKFYRKHIMYITTGKEIYERKKWTQDSATKTFQNTLNFQLNSLTPDNIYFVPKNKVQLYSVQDVFV